MVEIKMNNIETINGLIDSFSVLENIEQVPHLQSDVISTPEEIEEYYRGLYYDEGFTVHEYSPSDFGEAITLISTVEENIKII